VYRLLPGGRVSSRTTMDPQSFSANLATLLERKQTFDEALNGTAFKTVERQRLAMIQRKVFEQLARVVS
jgi:hypothetical protein